MAAASLEFTSRAEPQGPGKGGVEDAGLVAAGEAALAAAEEALARGADESSSEDEGGTLAEFD